MKIVMMGVQGSGKGTQCKLLAGELKLPHISTGDLFRANITSGNELGKRARQYTDRGQLVPDEIVIDMVAERLKADDAKDGFLLDGFPRNAIQLAALEYISPVEQAVLLELDDATAIGRLAGRTECGKCGIIYGANRRPRAEGICDECGRPLRHRVDDKDVKAIKLRLEVYHSGIDVMVRYYQWKGVLRRVDASGGVEEVGQAVLEAIKE